MTHQRAKGTGALYKNARGLWTASIELPPDTNGKRRRKVVSSKSKATAIRKLQSVQAELRARGDIVSETGITLNQWAAKWMGDPPRKITPNTLAGYRNELTRRILPALGVKPLRKLRVSDVQRLHQVYEQADVSGTTARLGHATLRVVLADAQRAGLVTENVADSAHIKPPAASTQEVELPDLEDLVRLTRVAAADPIMGTRWLTSLYTGLRQGETLGLSPNDVDPEKKVLRVTQQLQRLRVRHGCGGTCGNAAPGYCPQAEPIDRIVGAEHLHGSLFLVPPKSAKGRRDIPLVEPLRSRLVALAIQQQNHRLLWAAPTGGILTPENDAKLWRELRTRAGLHDTWKPHHARHAAATLMMAAGQPDRVIQAVVGHATVAMTRHYQHVDDQTAARAMQALADALGG